MLKNILSSLVIIVFISALSFTQTLNIHTNDGNVHPFNLADIDSITFSPMDTSITYLINDDFESYPIGSFPSSGGWYERYNGSGQNIVDNTHAHSGSKAFRLQGLPNWGATIENHNAQWQSNSIKMGYEIYVYPLGGGLGIHFFDYSPIWGAAWGGIGFGTDGYIYASGQQIMGYSSNQWYKVKVEIENIPPYKYKVWIDDIYYGEYPSPDNPNHNINESYFTIVSGHAGNYGWFDDAKVWYVRGTLMMRNY